MKRSAPSGPGGTEGSGPKNDGRKDMKGSHAVLFGLAAAAAAGVAALWPGAATAAHLTAPQDGPVLARAPLPRAYPVPPLQLPESPYNPLELPKIMPSLRSTLPPLELPSIRIEPPAEAARPASPQLAPARPAR